MVPFRAFAVTRVAVVIGAMLHLACSGSESGEPSGELDAGPDEPVVLAAFPYPDGHIDTQPDPERRMIVDETDWQLTWQRLTADRIPRAAPAVDFTRYSVVLVALGTRPHSGFGIEVSAALEDRVLRFEIVEVKAGDGCSGYDAQIQVVTLLRVPRYEGPVAFDERLEVRPCR